MSKPSEKFNGQYRIPSNRLKGWDYSSPGYYFVTICTKDKIPLFGVVEDDQILLSPIGSIVSVNLERIPSIYDHILLDAWIIMPNHIHAIIAIAETPQWGVSATEPQKSLHLGSIINQFKTACTKHIHKLGFYNFAWQPRYYDHIIRNQKSLDKIRAYILGNPAKWLEDEYFSSR
jgi:REP element-mobilizing transposase RayT